MLDARRPRGWCSAAAAPLGTSEIFDGLKIALTVVAGIGGVVALVVVAYRRQQCGEVAEARGQVNFGCATSADGVHDDARRAVHRREVDLSGVATVRRVAAAVRGGVARGA